MQNDVNHILPQDANNDAAKQERLLALNEDIFANDTDEFEQDAEEGLAQLPPAIVPSMVEKLNADLHKKIKKRKKEKRGIPSQQGTYVTIVTVFLLLIIGYLVVKKFLLP
jgi:hypothetical protein